MSDITSMLYPMASAPNRLLTLAFPASTWGTHLPQGSPLTSSEAQAETEPTPAPSVLVVVLVILATGWVLTAAIAHCWRLRINSNSSITGPRCVVTMPSNLARTSGMHAICASLVTDTGLANYRSPREELRMQSTEVALQWLPSSSAMSQLL